MSALSGVLFIVLGEGPSGRKGDGDPEDEKAGRTGWVMGSLYIGEEKSCLGNAATVTPRSSEHRLSGGLAGSRPAAQPTAREPQQSRGQRHPRLIRQSQGPRGSGNNWRISSPFPVFNTRLSSVWFEDAEVSRSWVRAQEGRGEASYY